jgi:hypothetical protein
MSTSRHSTLGITGFIGAANNKLVVESWHCAECAPCCALGRKADFAQFAKGH